MWLYPLPVILSVSIWLFIWYSTGLAAALGLLLTAIGVGVFYIVRSSWRQPMEVNGLENEVVS